MIYRGISLRISVTEACQLRCVYCRAETNAQSHPSNRPRLGNAELLSLVRLLHETVGIAKLRFTGGEPLLRRDLPALIAGCLELGISDLSLTTNGQRLAEQAPILRKSGLDRINVSLDSLHPATFAQVTRGGDLCATLAGIDAVLVQGMSPVKLNMVVLRGVNDDEIVNMLEFGFRTRCQVRFLELMPIGVAAATFSQRFLSSSEVLDRLATDYEFEEIPGVAGDTSRNFWVEDSRGRRTMCGFISPTSQPFCDGCNRLRLTHDGRLLGCLAHPESLDLLPALSAAAKGDCGLLADAVADALAMKMLPRELSRQRDMARIGG
ncbi:MAG: GTP 3',8-cyclase MoaA [Candidatus Hydrogenedentes bacterium]|nr:GTP 3',8-cyclase MoaA [Candidatus Hydrogenedentota bacterium]